MDKVVQIRRVILVDDEDETCCYCDCQFFHDPWPKECYCLIEGYGDDQEIQLTKQGEKWKRTQACLESEVVK
jgi:hypothetical protein